MIHKSRIHLLQEFINYFMKFAEMSLVESLVIKNPVTFKSFANEKEGIPDVHAQDQHKRHFDIELQSQSADVI